MIKVNMEKVRHFITRPWEVVIIRNIFILVFTIPLVMYLFWLFSEKHDLDIVIINKSVTDYVNMEERSINWILTHEHIVDNKNELYNLDSGYYGFYPRLGGDFAVRDFSGFDSAEVKGLVNQADMLFIADAYGVYTHDYGVDLERQNRLLYGGFNGSDLNVLKEFRAQDKLVISEFSLFGPPTSRSVRDSLQAILGIKWTGWTGRYFLSLDPSAFGDLPDWVVSLYHKNHGEAWPFTDSGIVLVRSNDIVILEYGTHLLQEAPIIETQPIYMNEYELPASVQYPFWFDIVSSPERANQVVSIFHLPVNARGDSLLTAHKVPRLFPAVLREAGNRHAFYYFAGDFSDNPVAPSLAYLKGIGHLEKFFYNVNNVEDRRQFFWRYYRPLLTNIIKSEVQQP